jgi:hypothetical protein
MRMIVEHMILNLVVVHEPKIAVGALVDSLFHRSFVA